MVMILMEWIISCLGYHSHNSFYNMLKLKKKLQEFWIWAQLTPEEYQKGIQPKNPDMYPGAEWEESYPQFQELEKAFIHDISQKENFENKEFITILVQAIAIDNESERLADFAIENLDENAIEKVLDEALDSHLTNAQWQLVSRIPTSSAKNKIKYLQKFLKEGENDYVKERAQYIIENIKE